MAKLRAALLGSVLVFGAIATAHHYYQFPLAPSAFLQWSNIRAVSGKPPTGDPALAPAIPVKVVRAQAADVPIYINGIGTVQAYNTVNVRSKVDGEIVQILFQEGQDVEQNDVLIKIDPRALQAQLNQQIAIREKDRALLNGALVDMKRYDLLAQQKEMAVTRQVVDQQHALVDQYRAQVGNDDAQIDYARTQLDFATIRSPISGRVGIRQVDQGNFVLTSNGTSLVVVTQLKPISVIFTISSVAIAQTKMSLGRTRLPVAALATDNATILDQGFVEVVDNQVDSTTGTLKIKASFPNDSLKLWPGNFVNGRITVDTRRSGVTIPEQAIRHGPRGDFVWVVQRDMTARARGVTVGQVFEGRCLVDRGVTRGELVVTDGYYRLQNGSRVDTQDPSLSASDQPAPSTEPSASSEVN
jgi:multidrug efflux system membrane fusion protein